MASTKVWRGFEPPTETENELVTKFEAALQASGRELPPHPECRSKTKLLRFVRGHRSVDGALRAYHKFLDYREEMNVEEARKAITAAAKASPNGKLVWPYQLAKFRPLVEGPWSGIPPAHHVGQDEHGNPVTMTVFASYNLAGVIDAGLSDLYVCSAILGPAVSYVCRWNWNEQQQH